MAKKFVINNGDLILGQVEYHKELLKGREIKKTSGGGFWHVDDTRNYFNERTIIFYGTSVDFGSVTREQFNSSSKSPSVESMNIYFSEKLVYSEVLEEIKKKL